LGGSSSWQRIIPAVATVIAAVGAANAFNDLRDLEADRINRPERPLPAGTTGVSGAWALVVALSAAAIASSLALGWGATASAAALLALGLAYSMGIKALPLVGHLTVALLFASCLLYGAIASGGEPGRHVFLAASQVLFFVFLREVVKTIPDVDGDRLAGTCSAAVQLGIDGAVRLIRWLGPVYLAVLVVPMVLGTSLVYLLAVTVGNGLPSFVIGRRLTGDPGVESARSAADASRWLFFTGSAAMLTMVV
jgi:4-hydroxybenzoate polyprenyltransferase